MPLPKSSTIAVDSLPPLNLSRTLGLLPKLKFDPKHSERPKQRNAGLKRKSSYIFPSNKGGKLPKGKGTGKGVSQTSRPALRSSVNRNRALQRLRLSKLKQKELSERKAHQSQRQRVRRSRSMAMSMSTVNLAPKTGQMLLSSHRAPTQSSKPYSYRSHAPRDPQLRKLSDNLAHKIIVSATVGSDDMSLITVMYSYSAEIVAAVIRHRTIHPRLPKLIAECDDDGNNIVHIAAFNNECALLDEHILPVLQSASVLTPYLNSENAKHCTPLDLAVYQGEGALCAVLLAAGATLGTRLYTTSEEYYNQRVPQPIKDMLYEHGKEPFDRPPPPIVEEEEESSEPSESAEPPIKKKKKKKRKKKRRKKRRRRKRHLKTSLSSNLQIVSICQYSNEDEDRIVFPTSTTHSGNGTKAQTSRRARSKTTLWDSLVQRSDVNPRPLSSEPLKPHTARLAEEESPRDTRPSSRSRSRPNSNRFPTATDDSFFHSSSFHEYV